MKNKLTKWDLRFIQRAKDVAEYSKDKNTKTGAVIVNDDKTEIVMGYNGFPRGADDDNYPKRYERPDKYFWTEHAERNALYKAARLGVSTMDTKMYCTYFPCADCSRAIIQGGVKQLYTEKPDFNHERWGESWVEALIMLRECGVEVIWTNINNDARWLGQYLAEEDLWYVSEHTDDGIGAELFFKTKEQLNDYAGKNDIVWKNLDDEV